MKEKTVAALSVKLLSICTGDSIALAPKDLDLFKELADILSYQLPLPVTEFTSYSTGLEGMYNDYELCPKCGLPLERTYQAYCDKCGQQLKWISKKAMTWKK